MSKPLTVTGTEFDVFFWPGHYTKFMCYFTVYSTAMFGVADPRIDVRKKR